jgi:hypothetical protein
MLLRAVGPKPTTVVGLAAVSPMRRHSVLVDNAKKTERERYSVFSISLCPYESTHMGAKEEE